MNQRKKRIFRTFVDILLELVGLVVLTVFLWNLQTDAAARRQESNSRTKLDIAQQRMEQNAEEAADNLETYDAFSQAKADAVAFCLSRNPETADLAALCEQWGLSSYYLLDAAGQVTQSSMPAGQRDLSAFAESLQSQSPVSAGDGLRYYFSSLPDGGTLICGRDMSAEKALLAELRSPARALRTIKVGTTGYVLAIGEADGTLAYHPDDSLLGADAAAVGYDPSQFPDGYNDWVTLGGARYYCMSRTVSGYRMAALVPESELTVQAGRTTRLSVLIFGVIISLLVVYALILRRDQAKHPTRVADYQKIGPLYRNRAMEAKLRNVALLGLLVVFLATFYLQTLAALSRQSLVSETKLDAVEALLEDNDDRIAKLTDEYNDEYAQRARNIAWTLAQDPSLVNDAALAELAKKAQITAIYVFNKSGRVVATNTNYKDFVLSDDETEQSYPFWAVVRGYVDELVQPAQKDDSMLHSYIQYVGVKRLDAEGMVQLGLSPRRIANRLQTTELSYVLRNIAVENDGMLFAVDPATNALTSYPTEKYIGRDAAQYGLTATALADGYAGDQTLEGESYFVTSRVWKDSVICVAVPHSTIYSQRLSTSLWNTGVSCVIILLLSCFLIFGGKPAADTPQDAAEERKLAPSRFFRLFQANGRSRMVQSAASRWSDVHQPWADKSPEQKLLDIIGTVVSVAVVAAVGWLWLFKAAPDKGSIIDYILGRKWEKGLNLFSLTFAAIKGLEILVITGIARRVVTFTLSRLGARCETIGRMLDSFIKYAAIISVFFYCLSALGVDSTTLITSAGILSLVVGLGAQKLIGDIVAGIFIVLEGEFRVGDIVTIGDWRGTVLEIGIRTTKIESVGSDIKIFNNSAITGVINMTKQFSFASTDIVVDKAESIERVEEMLAKELPRMKERLPAIVGGPTNDGVVTLTNANLTLRISAQCQEKDRVQLTRDLNREMKLLLDEYKVNAPK